MEFLNEALSDSQSRLTQFLKAVAVGVMNTANQSKYYCISKTYHRILSQGLVAEVTAAQLSKIYQVYFAGTNQLYRRVNAYSCKEASEATRSLSGGSLRSELRERLVPLLWYGSDRQLGIFATAPKLHTYANASYKTP